MRILSFIILAILAAGCGGSDAVVRTTDVLQIRNILEDDPLATKLTTEDGRTLSIGDVLLSDKGVNRAQVKETPEGTYDIELTLDERERVRMNNFWARDKAREVLVFIDGKLWGILNASALLADSKLLLANAAPTEEEAQQLADRLVLWKEKKKKQK